MKDSPIAGYCYVGTQYCAGEKRRFSPTRLAAVTAVSESNRIFFFHGSVWKNAKKLGARFQQQLSSIWPQIYIPLFEWSEVYHVRRLDQSRARQTNT